jgi:hypothetical protein
MAAVGSSNACYWVRQIPPHIVLQNLPESFRSESRDLHPRGMERARFLLLSQPVFKPNPLNRQWEKRIGEALPLLP